MSINRMLGAGFIAAAVAAGNVPSVEAQTTTYSKDGIAQCAATAKTPAFNMATGFANQLWSRVACGQYDSAHAMIDVAPKGDIIGLAAGKKGAEVVACYKDSFPTAVGPRNVTFAEGMAFSYYGPYAVDKRDARPLEAAMAGACQAKLGL